MVWCGQYGRCRYLVSPSSRGGCDSYLSPEVLTMPLRVTVDQSPIHGPAPLCMSGMVDRFIPNKYFSIAAPPEIRDAYMAFIAP